MPSKYSHSAVLAGYSSRGLINLSNDQLCAIYESSHAQKTPSPELCPQNSSLVGAWPQQRAPASGANSLRRYADSSDNLSSPGAQRQISAAHYHNIDRRLILDSDSDSDDPVPHIQSQFDSTSSSPSTSRSRSVDTPNSQPRQRLPLVAGVIPGYQGSQSNVKQNYYAFHSKAPTRSVVESSGPGPTRSPTEINDTDEERSVRLSSDADGSETARTSEETPTEDRLPSPPPKDIYSDDHNRPWPPTMLVSMAHPSDTKDLSKEPTPRSRQGHFDRQDSSPTVHHSIEQKPLPDTADFDDFTDADEPDFIKRLVVSGRGTTSSSRSSGVRGLRSPPPVDIEISPRAPPPPSPSAQNTPSKAEFPLRSSSRTITVTPRSSSRTSMTRSTSTQPFDLNPPPNINDSARSRYNSFSTISSHCTLAQTDTLHYQSSLIGVPSIVRSPSKNQPRRNSLSKRLSQFLDDTQQILTPSKPSTRQSNISVQRRQQEHSKPSSSHTLPEITRASSLRGSLGSFARTSFFHDDDRNADSDSDSDYPSAAPAPAVHLQSKRDSLLARHPISLTTSHSTPILRAHSRPLTHLRDSSSDIESFTTSTAPAPPAIIKHVRKPSGTRRHGSPGPILISTPIVFTTSPLPTPPPTRSGASPSPPDIAKYRVRNGLMSPLAQLEMIHGADPRYGAMSKEEKVREAEGRLERARGREKGGEEKGFWGKLRERSLGRRRRRR